MVLEQRTGQMFPTKEKRKEKADSVGIDKLIYIVTINIDDNIFKHSFEIVFQMRILLTQLSIVLLLVKIIIFLGVHNMI